MREPLLLPLAAVAAGIVLGRWLGLSLSASVWPAWAFAGLAIAAYRIGSSRLMCLAGGLTLLLAGVILEAWHRPGPPPKIDAGSKEVVVLEGCVVDPTVFSADREQFTLELAPGARARVSLPVDDTSPSQRLAYGQRVEIEARMRPPHNFNNPGSFDYATYLARQKIFWTASMSRRSVARILPGRCGSRIIAVVYRLRTAAIERLESLYPNDDYAAGMMEAILIGETSRLERVWTENFRRTGTFHALVISGVHVTVLAGVLLFMLRLMHLPEMTSLAITAAAAWLYALVSGLSAPVVRAAGGFTLFLIARYFFRRTRVLNLLAAVALVYLVWDPEEMFDPSFQLSFLCVAAIGALGMPLLEAVSAPYSRALRSINRMNADPYLPPRAAQFRIEIRLAAETLHFWTRVPAAWAAQLLALALRAVFFAFDMAVISTVVQVGLALPMAEYFHRISLTGLTANLLIVPMMEWVVPLGFVAIFTGCHWVGWLAGRLVAISARVANWHAALEPSWRVADPPVWLAACFVAVLVASAIAWRHRILRIPAAALLVALFTLLLWHPWPPNLEPGLLELTSIDVGQGDSLLVVLPRGEIMLVDGGGILRYGRAHKSNLDIGEDVVSPYLWSRGIRRVDVVVATHAHEDHIGGIPALLENFRPRELWTGANPQPAMLEQAARLGIRVIEQTAGPAFDLSGATLQVLAPLADYRSSRPGNNDSLALRIAYGARSLLLTGDLERPIEARLLSAGEVQSADILKVGHHGSKTSTIQPFLDAVSPSIAVISAGFENSFGHPHPDVLARLNARHTAILRTDQSGLVTVLTDGQRVWFDTRRAEASSGFARLWALNSSGDWTQY